MEREDITPGPCLWNGNEIVQEEEPDKGIAGIAPDAPEEWGPLFAAAPDMAYQLMRTRDMLKLMQMAMMFDGRKDEWEILKVRRIAIELILNKAGVKFGAEVESD